MSESEGWQILEEARAQYAPDPAAAVFLRLAREFSQAEKAAIKQAHENALRDLGRVEKENAELKKTIERLKKDVAIHNMFCTIPLLDFH